MTRGEGHLWDGCYCSKCGAQNHEWKDGRCATCGVRLNCIDCGKDRTVGAWIHVRGSGDRKEWRTGDSDRCAQCSEFDLLDSIDRKG